jgi:hypothetical protein
MAVAACLSPSSEGRNTSESQCPCPFWRRPESKGRGSYLHWQIAVASTEVRTKIYFAQQLYGIYAPPITMISLL